MFGRWVVWLWISTKEPVTQNSGCPLILRCWLGGDRLAFKHSAAEWIHGRGMGVDGDEDDEEGPFGSTEVEVATGQMTLGSIQFGGSSSWRHQLFSE